VERYGARKLITLGALIGGLGFFWLTFISSLWSFYGGYVVVGVGMTAMGMVPTTRVVSNWFTKRRGLAVGIMSSGAGVGALVLAPILGAYIIPDFGWRATYMILALMTWTLIIPAALLVIKTSPADIGLYPDGMQPAEVVAESTLSSQTNEAWALSRALKTSAFWLIATAFLITTFSHTGTIQHQINYLDDIGFPVAMAAVALGAVGFGSAAGKLFFGWLCDQMPAKYAAIISFVLQLAAVIILMTVKQTTPLAMIWLYAILMGIGAGGWTPLMSILISNNFGLAAYGTIFGAASLLQMLGTAFGPLLAGQMFDAMQTYLGVLITFVVLYMIVIPSMLAVRRPKLRSVSSS